MKRRQRQRQILDLLTVHDELSVDEACALTAASPATIRRAFAELADEGAVEKTWGGIRRKERAPTLSAPPVFAQRLAERYDEKRAIAQAAAGLLADGDVVMIDGGTTTFQLAEFVAGRRIRVITNSLVIAQAIDQAQGSRRGAEVLLSGGTLQPESGIIAGPAAEAFLKRYRAQWLFMGCAGVDAQHVSNYDEAVLGSEKLMIERSRRVIVLADPSKIGRQAMCPLCPTRAIDYLFTGSSADPIVLKAIEELGVRVAAVSP